MDRINLLKNRSVDIDHGRPIQAIWFLVNELLCLLDLVYPTRVWRNERSRSGGRIGFGFIDALRLTSSLFVFHNNGRLNAKFIRTFVCIRHIIRVRLRWIYRDPPPRHRFSVAIRYSTTVQALFRCPDGNIRSSQGSYPGSSARRAKWSTHNLFASCDWEVRFPHLGLNAFSCWLYCLSWWRDFFDTNSKPSD